MNITIKQYRLKTKVSLYFSSARKTEGLTSYRQENPAYRLKAFGLSVQTSHLLIIGQLQPLNVTKVLTMGQVLVLGIHTHGTAVLS